MSQPLLSVTDLSIEFKVNNTIARVINSISFDINKGETFALVGESGSGKSVTALSILRLLDKEQTLYPTGDIVFENQSILHADELFLRQLRGQQISMIFQDPRQSLNPLHTIEKQLYEVLSLHKGMAHSVARSEIIQCLDRVGIKEAKNRLSAYPHQLSGGECQRVMIAMAILTHPKLLIADEPTTALDVSVQAQIIQLIRELKHELKMSVLFISHNLNVVKKIADKIAVMQKGKIIEQNSRQRIFLAPEQEYTKQLLNATPIGKPNVLPDTTNNLLSVENLSVHVATKKNFWLKTRKCIVHNISFSLKKGESMAIVGESGSGKSTTALAILRLIQSDGRIIYNGDALQSLTQKQLLPFRKKIQIIFQNPYSSLNPRFTVQQIIQEGLITHQTLSRDEQHQKVLSVMQEVGLDPDMCNRYPHQFSGGQRQRIAIARSLVVQPELLILDEPTSSLDHSVQLQIIELLKSLQARHQLSYLFISHDLSLVYSFCHSVIVMKDTRIEEQGTRENIFHNPKSDYTKMLLSFLDKPTSLSAQIKMPIKAPPLHNKSRDDRIVNWEDALLMHKK